MIEIIDPTPEQVLSCPIGANPVDAPTIGAYLIATLAELWREGGNFSGRRPLGDSDWDGPIAVALIRAGYVEGEIDEDGYLDGYDDKRVDRLVAEAIQSLAPAGATT